MKHLILGFAGQIGGSLKNYLINNKQDFLIFDIEDYRFFGYHYIQSEIKQLMKYGKL
jgi:nucleoside-diphosphate-sugar epimerase